MPKHKANIGISWEKFNWDIYYAVQHISSLNEYIPSLDKTKTINSWTTNDVQLNFFSDKLETKFTFGIDNLFDTSPPYIATTFNDNYDGKNYDIAGQFYYFRLKKN